MISNLVFISFVEKIQIVQLSNGMNTLEDQILFIYPMYQINHFEDIPVQLIDSEKHYIANSMLLYFPNAIGGQWMTFEWETVKYSDKKSMLDLLTNRQREYTFGNLKN